MNITYDYYRIFYFVAKYQSFTKAASILLSNEPNISRSIRNLEHEFGVSLFIRSNRGVTLTPEGQKLYTRVAAAHHQLSSAEAELADAKSLTSGTITLGVSEAALQILLLPKLREFHQKFPEIKIHISSVTTPQAVSSLKSGLVDLAIVTSPTGVTRPLKEIPLRPIREVLIGGPRFASLSGTPKTLKELADYPFILLNLVLSCVAAIRAPLIMMSQNRQEEKDRRRAENDYKVNLKTEIMIEDLHDKVNAILIRQSQIEKLLSEQKEKNTL